MSKKYSVALLVISALLASTMSIGTSYSFWTLTKEQNGSNIVEAGCLNIEINDVDINDNSTSISLTNTYPISDTNGLLTNPYVLTITNTCSIKASYSVLLNTLSNSLLTENNIKYHFVKTFPEDTYMAPNILGNLTPVNFSADFVNELNTKLASPIRSTYVIGEGVLNPVNNNVEDSVTYNLRMWIDEDTTNEVMGNTFEAGILVYAEATE